nr:MAG TPA: hypothetical protein [Caudoviricetes sp.]
MKHEKHQYSIQPILHFPHRRRKIAVCTLTTATRCVLLYSF